MDNDSGVGRDDSGDDRNLRYSGQVSPELSLKVVVVLVSVVVLSLGIVGCTVFFIFECFAHPDAAKTLLPILIPAAGGAVTYLTTKKISEVLTRIQDKKSK
jgi:zinc transporter ZupT